MMLSVRRGYHIRYEMREGGNAQRAGRAINTESRDKGQAELLSRLCRKVELPAGTNPSRSRG